MGKCPEISQGTERHQFTHTECAQQLNEYLAGNLDHFKHFAGNPKSPKESCSSLEEAVGFQSFVFANKWKILLAGPVNTENDFAIYE